MAETEDLKSFQYRFESDRGHQFVRKSSHEVSIDSIIQIVNAYTMHTHCSKDSKAIIRCSVPSAPDHLRSSRARPPSVSAIGVWGPGVINFERAGISTPSLEMSAQETILAVCEKSDF